MKKEFVIAGSISLREAFVKDAKLSTYNDETVPHFNYLVPYSLKGRRVQGSVGVGDRELFTLPQDYEKAMKYVNDYYIEGKEEKAVDINSFGVGDWVVVLEEDDHYYNSEKRAQKVESHYSVGDVQWVSLIFQDGHINSYNKVRMATEEEIKVASLHTICGYKREITKGRVKYGCKHFSKREVGAIITALKCFDELGEYMTLATAQGIKFRDEEFLTPDELRKIYEEM